MWYTDADASKWFDRGVEECATHMVIVNESTYPLYVYEDEDVSLVKAQARSSTQVVMDVYDLREDKEEQIEEMFGL